jgi:hypothetical protein
MNYKIKYIISLLIIFLLVIACSKTTKNISNEKKSSEEKKGVAKDSTTIPIEQIVVSNWQYFEKTDRMSDDKTYFAQCKAINTVDFDFPYQGGSTFTLTLRKRNNKNEILLSVSKGQFITSIFDSERLRVKFDNEASQNYSYNSPSDGSANIIFINNENSFIAKLKKSKKVLIEAEFYTHGREIIEFNVEGLEWK